MQDANEINDSSKYSIYILDISGFRTIEDFYFVHCNRNVGADGILRNEVRTNNSIKRSRK